MLRMNDTTSLTFRKYVDERGQPTIMQVLPALNAGGVEQGVIDINRAIVEAGGKSIVVSSGGKRVYEIQRNGGMHIELPVHSKNPLTMYANVKRLRALIRENNVDVVHACSRAPAWSCARAVRGTMASFVTSCHAAHKVSGTFKRAYNRSITKGERAIAVSHFLADYLETEYDTDPTKIRVIHRGVALEKFHPNSVTPDRLVKISQDWRLPEGAQIIFMPARLTRLKGHMFLVDALAELKDKDIFCILLGTVEKKSNYSKELIEHIEKKGLSEQIRIVDRCDDMPAAYMISTVVVSPSLVPEGFGRIPIEAQAMGRAVIATDHGGSKETIIRDETGWLIKLEDTEGFTKALHEALTLNDKGRAVLATRGMSHVAEHFTVEQMCSKTLDVYAELLTKNMSRALPPGGENLSSYDTNQDGIVDAVELEYGDPPLKASANE